MQPFIWSYLAGARLQLKLRGRTHRRTLCLCEDSSNSRMNRQYDQFTPHVIHVVVARRDRHASCVCIEMMSAAEPRAEFQITPPCGINGLHWICGRLHVWSCMCSHYHKKNLKNDESCGWNHFQVHGLWRALVASTSPGETRFRVLSAAHRGAYNRAGVQDHG